MEDDYVEGLTGTEIIEDALDQVQTKLRADCNLREADAYTGGYDGYVDVHLNLHGLDTVKVETRIPIGAPALVAPGPDDEAITVDAHVDIPLEARLNVVRERSGQEVPTLAKDDEGHVVVKKRRYARSNQ